MLASSKQVTATHENCSATSAACSLSVSPPDGSDIDDVGLRENGVSLVYLSPQSCPSKKPLPVMPSLNGVDGNELLAGTTQGPIYKTDKDKDEPLGFRWGPDAGKVTLTLTKTGRY